MSSSLSIARPYAKAIFEIAEKESAFSKWSDMLHNASLIVRQPQVRAWIKNPTFDKADLDDLIIALGKQTFSDEMKILIKLLGDFNRLEFLPEISEVFEKMITHAQRVIPVELTSAYVLQEPQKEKIMKMLGQYWTGKVTLECHVDQSLLGGVVIRSGDWVLDSSIRGKLSKLGESMGIY